MEISYFVANPIPLPYTGAVKRILKQKKGDPMYKAAYLLAALSVTTSLYPATDPAHYDQNTAPVQFVETMEALKAVTLRGDEKVLDFGCRSGKATLWFAQQLPNGKVLALDYDQAMLGYTQAQLKAHNLKNCICLQYSPSALAFYKNTFDYITSFAYLHWIGNYESTFPALYMALKAGGKIIMRVGVSDKIGRKIPFQCHVDAVASRNRWKNYFIKLLKPWYHPLDIETAQKILDATGFTTTRITYVQHMATFATTEELANWILTWSPHAHELPAGLALQFATEVAERYDASCPHDYRGYILLERPALEIEAQKSAPTPAQPQTEIPSDFTTATTLTYTNT